jgi:hypothetical protein
MQKFQTADGSHKNFSQQVWAKNHVVMSFPVQDARKRQEMPFRHFVSTMNANNSESVIFGNRRT